MAEFIRVNGGLMNLEHIVEVEPVGNGVRINLSDRRARIVEGDQAVSVKRSLEKSTRCGPTRDERAAWANAAVQIANELVGQEPTAQKRRELSTRLLELSERIVPRPLIERRA